MKLIKMNTGIKRMSFEEVYNKHENLIYSMTTGVQIGNGLNKIDGEDLKQRLALVMWNVYNDYDIEKGVNFSTLLVTSVRNEIVNLRKQVTRQKRELMNDVGYLDTKMKEDDTKTFLESLSSDKTLEEEVFDTYKNDDDIINQCEDIVKKICVKGKDIEELKLLLLVQDKPMIELAKEMGISRQCLSQKVKRIRAKFQKRLV